MPLTHVVTSRILRQILGESAGWEGGLNTLLISATYNRLTRSSGG